MNKNYKNIALIVLGILVTILLVRVVFDEKFDNFDTYVQDRENYKDGPEAYDKNLEALGKWSDDYKAEHPGATDADVDAAFNAAWGN